MIRTGAAQVLMLADLQQDLRINSGKPLVFHQLDTSAGHRWYWYQRYHHFWSMASVLRPLCANRQYFCTWLRGEPTPASPFTPFADVMEKYQQYRESEAWRRDAAFWAEQRRQLPPPASLSPAPLAGRSASAEYSAPEELEFTDGEFQAGYTTFRCAAYRFSPCAGSLVAGAIVQSHDYAAGFSYASTGLGGADG
ncbi:condensation domain-containing protein [Shigella flexneri]